MVFNVVGLVGAYLFSIYLKDIDLGQFIEHVHASGPTPRTTSSARPRRWCSGVTLSVAACYQGFNVRGGAKEVGLATTRAVVAGSVSILVADYFLIDAFHILWPYR